MKPIPPVLNSEKREPKLIFIWNRGEFLVEPKETKQNFALFVKVRIFFPPTKIPEEKRLLMEKFKPPWHHSVSIRHDFKDLSCRRRMLEMKVFNSSKSYQLPLAGGRDVFYTVCQVLSPNSL